MERRGLFSSAAIAAGAPSQELLDNIDELAVRAVLADWYEDRGVFAKADLDAIGRITEIMKREHEIGWPDRGALSIEKRKLENEKSEIERRLRGELAGARGWMVAPSRFEFRELATGRRPESPSRYAPTDKLDELESRCLDHEEYFREPARPFRPTAILTHSYNTELADFEQLAAPSGLVVEILPWSWYYPGDCTAALFTRPPTWKQGPSRQEIERTRRRELTQEMREIRKRRGGRT